ncbi:MAG: hypothetical protein WCK77_14830 [Verrucomicrobiota bacterium]
MKLPSIFTYFLLVTLPLGAQEQVKHTLRVLPLGDPPPFVQEMRDGARYEVPPPAGVIPPRMVMIPAPAKPGAAQQASQPPLRLRLGRPSVAVTLTDPQQQQVALNLEQGANWLNVPLDPCGSSLALVWRWGKSWDKARTLVLPDDSAARAEGNVQFANLTASSMGVVFGTEKLRLEPGMTFSRKLTADSPATSVEILYPSPSGGFKLCLSTRLDATPGVFSRLLIYAADGHNPRLPVKVLRLDEPS